MGPSGNLSPTLAMNFLHYTTPFPPKKAGAAVKGVRENPGSMCDVLLCVIRIKGCQIKRNFGLFRGYTSKWG